MATMFLVIGFFEILFFLFVILTLIFTNEIGTKRNPFNEE